MAGRRRPELGQHYLRRETAARLVRLSGITARDLVVEIGAGRGVLTGYLAARAKRVIAIELDPVLASRLRREFSGDARVEVVEGDFLAAPLPSDDFSVVANIPFGDTARIVARVLGGRPRGAWLVVQREAAERYAGHPWSGETLQSLVLKPRWEIEVRGYPRRTDFDPPPSVDAAVLCFRRREVPLVAGPGYTEFIEECFGRGTTAAQCLRRVFPLFQIRRLAHDLNFAEIARPSDLTFDQWLALYRVAAREVL